MATASRKPSGGSPPGNGVDQAGGSNRTGDWGSTLAPEASESTTLLGSSSDDSSALRKDSWVGFEDFEGLPWWKTPSVCRTAAGCAVAPLRVLPDLYLTCRVMLGVVDDGAVCVLYARLWGFTRPEAELVRSHLSFRIQVVSLMLTMSRGATGSSILSAGSTLTIGWRLIRLTSFTPSFPAQITHSVDRMATSSSVSLPSLSC